MAMISETTLAYLSTLTYQAEAKQMLNVAIVGLGNIGNTHAKVYQKLADVKLVAVCDIDEA